MQLLERLIEGQMTRPDVICCLCVRVVVRRGCCLGVVAPCVWKQYPLQRLVGPLTFSCHVHFRR